MLLGGGLDLSSSLYAMFAVRSFIVINCGSATSSALEMMLLLRGVLILLATYILLLSMRIICLEVVVLVAVANGVLVLEPWGVL